MGKWSGEELTPLMLILFLIYQIGIPYGIGYLIASRIGDTKSTLAIGSIFMVIWVPFLGPLTIQRIIDEIVPRIEKRIKG